MLSITGISSASQHRIASGRISSASQHRIGSGVYNIEQALGTVVGCKQQLRCHSKDATSSLLSTASVVPGWGAPKRVQHFGNQTQTRKTSAHANIESFDSSRNSDLDRAVSWVQKFASEQFLPLCLVTAVIIGFNFPTVGMAVSKTPLQTCVTMTIFLMAGVSLKRDDAVKAISSYGVCNGS
jgi:hypothetical protein